MKVVLSFADEDALLAETLITCITQPCEGLCTLVPSSEPPNAIGGEKTLEAAQTTLEMATLYFVLLSPASAQKTWVQFNLACAWAKSVPVYCLSYSWQAADQLPSPFSAFPFLDMNAPTFLPDLLQIIQDNLGSGDLPSLNLADLQRDIAEAVSIQKASAGRDVLSAAGTPPIMATSAGIETEILRQFVEQGAKRNTAKELALALAMTEIKTQYYLDRLTEQNKLHRSPNLFLWRPRYSLTREGRAFLAQSGLI